MPLRDRITIAHTLAVNAEIDQGRINATQLKRSVQREKILMRLVISPLRLPSHFIAFLPVSVFCLFFAWRPFFFGFVHDDWSIFVVPNQLALGDLIDFSFSSYDGRPGIGFFFLMANLVWDGSPQMLVMLTSGIVALCALALYLFLRQIEDGIGVRTYASEVGTTAWLAKPWGMGYSVWNSGSTTLFCMMLFLISSIYCVRFVKTGYVYNLALAVIFLTLSYCTYEAFYLGFVAVVLVALIICGFQKIYVKRAILASSLLVAVQIAVVLAFMNDTPKSVDIDPVFILGNALYKLPEAVLVSYGWLAPLFVISVVIISSYTFKQILDFRFEHRRQSFLLVIVALLGIGIGTLPFSIAHYAIQGLGTFSRTTMSVDLWIAVLVLLLWSARENKNFSIKLPVYFMWPLLLLVSLTAGALNLYPWHLSWERQQQILNGINRNTFSDVQREDVILLDSRSYICGV